MIGGLNRKDFRPELKGLAANGDRIRSDGADDPEVGIWILGGLNACLDPYHGTRRLSKEGDV